LSTGIAAPHALGGDREKRQGLWAQRHADGARLAEAIATLLLLEGTIIAVRDRLHVQKATARRIQGRPVTLVDLAALVIEIED
jgi:hypothetical protein